MSPLYQWDLDQVCWVNYSDDVDDPGVYDYQKWGFFNIQYLKIHNKCEKVTWALFP